MRVDNTADFRIKYTIEPIQSIELPQNDRSITPPIKLTRF